MHRIAQSAPGAVMTVGSCRRSIWLRHWLSMSSLMLCRVYELYNNFVLKNPFYEVEMPVRCELFDTNLIGTVAMLHRRWGVATQ